MKYKKAFLVLGGMTLFVWAAVFSYGKDQLVDTLHNASHKVGLCKSADLAARFAGLQENSVAACARNPACAPSNAGITLAQFSEHERKIIDYVCDLVVSAEPGEKLHLDPQDIEAETGISLQGMNLEQMQAGVLAELNRRSFNFTNLGGGYCSKFSACSVDRDLNGAAGEELVRYQEEKAQDGMVFSNWYAPDFTLPTTDGHQVSLSDHRGRPVAVVFLSGHCSHSFDTLPVLKELKRKYQKRDLVILPVYVNSGSVKDISTWSSEMNLGYSFAVAKTKELSKAYDSRMVPSTFLIDREGRVKQKLVGYKDQHQLESALAKLL